MCCLTSYDIRERGIREMGGAPRNPAPRSHCFGADWQIIRLPLHRWALEKQSFH